LSWFKNLAETYDNVSDIVGIPDTNGNTLLPPNHMTANTDICVVTDGNGNFLRAYGKKEDALNIVIPCTEDSAVRTSGIIPHPLHDQIGYLSSNEKKREAYLLQLEKWSMFHPKAEAVRKYVLNNTLIDDLQSYDIKFDEKSFVRFAVDMSLDDKTPNLWEDKSVSEAWQRYCEQEQNDNKSLCYITGVEDIIKTKHPKNINSSTGNAKLISCNDETNYTYKGRFTEAEQANAIGDKASHQAHAMLKYLIAAQGYKCDTQAIVAWSVNDGSALPDLFEDSLEIYGDAVNTERETLLETQTELAFDYAKNLASALRGKGNADSLKNINKRVAVIAVDAATTGRMAVTFYKDLSENEYIERVINWHKTCRWHFRGKDKSYVSAPSADRIIAAVYGEPKGEGYSKIKKQARERILNFILNGEIIDKSWLNAAVNRVSNPFSYNKQDGGWDKYKWDTAVNITCAMTRKYYTDNANKINKKEEFSLELEKTRNDRDYLYGRMLAVADKIESHARYLQTGKNDTDKRPTNAVRYISAFATKPFRTWEVIYRQLVPYIQRLNGGEWYQKQIDEIMSLFKDGEYENDKPLDGKYLMGYSLQRREFNNKNNEEETDNAE